MEKTYTNGGGLLSKFFSKESSASNIDLNSNTISGSPSFIAQCVYSDINSIKSEIKQYNELTGLMSSNPFYYKIYKLLENDHTNEIKSLKIKFNYDTSSKNFPYQKQLIATYKKHLRDLQNLLDTFEYNYNQGIRESHIINNRARSTTKTERRKNSEDSVLSNTSSRMSLASSTSSCSPPSLHHNNQLDSSTSTTDTKRLIESIDADAPDYLIDPISFNLFNEPVISPSGITYEKSHILMHLSEKGKSDPLTRIPLTESQLYPNLIVKNAVIDYMESKKKSLA